MEKSNIALPESRRASSLLSERDFEGGTLGGFLFDEEDLEEEVEVCFESDECREDLEDRREVRR